MTLLRSVPFLGSLAVATLFAIESSAADRETAPTTPSPTAIEPTHKHRLVLGAGYENSWFHGGADGHYDDTFSRPGGHVGYAYRFVKGFELGGDVSFHSGMVILLAPSIRGYFTIGSGDPVEVGFTARPSLLVASGYSHTWIGPALSFGPDVRVWVSDDIGLQLSGEALGGHGSTDKSPDEVYLHDDAGFLAYGGSLSIVWRN
jgi:hypothetical protein